MRANARIRLFGIGRHIKKKKTIENYRAYYEAIGNDTPLPHIILFTHTGTVSLQKSDNDVAIIYR